MKYLLVYGQEDDNGIIQKTITFDDLDYAILIYRYQVKEYKDMCGDNCFEKCSDISKDVLESSKLFSYIYDNETGARKFFVELNQLN